MDHDNYEKIYRSIITKALESEWNNSYSSLSKNKATEYIAKIWGVLLARITLYKMGIHIKFSARLNTIKLLLKYEYSGDVTISAIYWLNRSVNLLFIVVDSRTQG